MGKKSFSRVDAEKAEGLETTKNDVPENRLQADQQIQDTAQGEKLKPIRNGFQTKKIKGKGTQLKQQAIADALTGASDASGMGITAAGRSVSGTAGGILGASNSTPVADKTRRDSRIGKKLERVANKLNYTPSEQVIVEFDESKPLADAADMDQGYNGTYRNEFARSQKIMGAVPADLMFQRSVDLIMKDKLYYVEGQQAFQVARDKYDLNPKHIFDHIDISGEPEYREVAYKSGNYLHKGFSFGLGVDGKVRYFFAPCEDLSIDVVEADDANAVTAHKLIKQNVAELDRITMDAKAGDEKADIWTPLARAVVEPTQLSYIMSSIEAETGAYCYLAYAKASTNMSYQLNRGPKDGLEVVTPAIEQLMGWRNTYGDGKSLKTAYNGSIDDLFDTDCYRAGDPSLMIAAYDSVSKYHNKADLLLQPRGWRMHLQTADNNINPLKVPEEFAQVFSGQECFSTIDHEYDPLLPICMTDKANLILVHNLNEQCGFIKGTEYDIVMTFTNLKHTDNATYDYYDVIPQGLIKALGYENFYIYTFKSAGDGLVYNSSTGAITFDDDANNGTKTNKIKVFTEALSAADLDEGGDYEDWTLLATVPADANFAVTLRVPKVQDRGAGDMRVSAVSTTINDEVIEFKDAGHIVYAYSDLRNNYIVDVKHPLVAGIIAYLEESIGGKIRSLIKRERFDIPLVFSTQYMTLAQIFICAATPWITRVRMNSMKDVLYLEDNIGLYPYSKLKSIKDVPFKNYVNFVYTDYDSPLECKVMNPVEAIQWIMPEFFWKLGSGVYVLPWYFNENDVDSSDHIVNDAANMSMPSIRSGIRLAALDTLYGMSEKDIRLSLDRLTKPFLRGLAGYFYAYKYGRTTDGQLINDGNGITIGDVLCSPRELGLCQDAPLGILTLDPADSGAYKALTADAAITSFRIKVWTNPEALDHPIILNDKGVNINRAANYSQKWVELFANGATSNTDVNGLVFGLNDEGAAAYEPFAAIGSGAQISNTITGNPTITSLQRSLWTRLQMLPFVISPFDAIATASGGNRDIYDVAYMFGLAGFRASDYRESVYNREKEVVNQGMLFVDDPWVIESPIVKHGASATGVSITKGYELKKN